jgi:hypothetical protein
MVLKKKAGLVLEFVRLVAKQLLVFNSKSCNRLALREEACEYRTTEVF